MRLSSFFLFSRIIIFSRTVYKDLPIFSNYYHEETRRSTLLVDLWISIASTWKRAIPFRPAINLPTPKKKKKNPINHWEFGKKNYPETRHHLLQMESILKDVWHVDFIYIDFWLVGQVWHRSSRVEFSTSQSRVRHFNASLSLSLSFFSLLQKFCLPDLHSAYFFNTVSNCFYLAFISLSSDSLLFTFLLVQHFSLLKIISEIQFPHFTNWSFYPEK